MAETDLADVRLKHARAIGELAKAGVLDPAALGRATVSQCEADGWLAGLAGFSAEAAQPAPVAAEDGGDRED